MARASNKNVKLTEKGATSYFWEGTTYQWGWNGILLYDAQDAAERLAESLGARVKHAANKFPECAMCGGVHWRVMSVVLHR